MILSAAAQAQERPRTNAWVTDDGNLLTSGEEQILVHKLSSYADTTSSQIAIVTKQNLQGEDIATYATELGEMWGIGQQDKDNGVVILVAREEREVFIAVGYGLEAVLPDATASRIIRNTITPQFRQGQFFQGLSLAVDQIMMAAAGEFMPDIMAAIPARKARRVDFCGLAFFVLLLVIFVNGFFRNRGGGGQGPRRRTSNDSILPLLLLGHAAGRGGFGGGGFGGGFGGGGFGGGFGGGGFGGGGAGGGW